MEKKKREEGKKGIEWEIRLDLYEIPGSTADICSVTARRASSRRIWKFASTGLNECWNRQKLHFGGRSGVVLIWLLTLFGLVFLFGWCWSWSWCDLVIIGNY